MWSFSVFRPDFSWAGANPAYMVGIHYSALLLWMVYPIIYRVLTIQGGAGFRNHPQ